MVAGILNRHTTHAREKADALGDGEFKLANYWRENRGWAELRFTRRLNRWLAHLVGRGRLTTVTCKPEALGPSNAHLSHKR